MKHKFVELAELVAKALDNLDEGLHGDLIESRRFSERMENFRNTVWDIRILAERVKKKIEEESYQDNLPDATMGDLFQERNNTMTRDIGELKRFARFLYHLSQALNSIEGNAKLTYHTKEIEGFMEYTMKQIMRLENSKSFLETLNFDHTNGDFT